MCFDLLMENAHTFETLAAATARAFHKIALRRALNSGKAPGPKPRQSREETDDTAASSAFVLPAAQSSGKGG